MAFCSQCGANIPDEANTCTACGAPVETTVGAAAQQVNAQQQPNYQQPQQPNYQQPQGNTYGTSVTPDGKVPRNTPIDPADITANKGISVLCYFGIFALIPMLTKKNSLFVRYHAKQGVILFLAEIIVSILSGILSSIAFLSIIMGLLGTAIFVFAILGIVNACQGQAKEIPLVGSIDAFDGIVDALMK